MSLFSFKYEQLTKIKIKDFLKRLYTKSFDEEDITSNAAQVAYYFLLALFPLLLFLVSLFGITISSANDLKGELFSYLNQAMPGSAYELVQKTIEEVSQNSSGGKLTFGILAALWAASAGLDSIRVVLNGIYNVTETRAWWKTKLISLGMTLGLGILVTFALGAIFYGSKFILLILSSLNLPIQSPILLSILQYVTLTIVLVSIFALIYNYLPKHKEYKWVWVSPGAIIAIILWLAFSFGFRLYLGYFNTYDKTYGSLGAVIILMLWLYLTALVILIGGSMNAVLQEFTDPDTAEAGAKKAAAKAVVQNPDDKTSEASTVHENKKAEVLSTLNQNNDNKNDVDRSNAIPTSSERPVVTENVTSHTKKSPLKLATGLIVGMLENIFSSKRK
jgi:membrane protein